MIKVVSSKTQLSLMGRTFELVWDDGEEPRSTCDRCALLESICSKEPKHSLVSLCGTMQAEPNTFFVERKVEIGL